MRVTKDIEEARELHAKAIEALEEQDSVIQALPDDTPDENRDFQHKLFETRKSDVESARETLERLIALKQAREQAPLPSEKNDEARETRDTAAIRIGKEAPTYAPVARGFNFFNDMYKAVVEHDAVAMERLQRNNREQLATNPKAVDHRAMSTTATAGGNFIPPQYLGDYFAEYARAGRPFANVVPSSPLMETGMSITVPRITTGSLVAVQITQNTSLGTQDIVEALLTVPVVTIGGYSDLSVQLAERSDPSFDQILFNDLRADYDRLLDNQLINGTGSNGQHLGIRSVSSINTVTYTAATPTAAGLFPKIYDGIQQISTNRYAEPDTLVLHNRRSAWLASNLSSTFPLFQVGSLNQAGGTQNAGFVTNFAGLPNIVADPNVTVLQGAGTNEDEVYVVRVADMHLWEGPIRAEVFRDVGSANGTVRVRLYAFSAFASGRFPKSITKISGTGLVTPSF